MKKLNHKVHCRYAGKYEKHCRYKPVIIHLFPLLSVSDSIAGKSKHSLHKKRKKF